MINASNYWLLVVQFVRFLHSGSAQEDPVDRLEIGAKQLHLQVVSSLRLTHDCIMWRARRNGC